MTYAGLIRNFVLLCNSGSLRRTCCGRMEKLFVSAHRRRGIRQSRILFYYIGKIVLSDKSPPGRIAGSAPAKRGHSVGGEKAAGVSPPQAEYPAKPDTFLLYRKDRPVE